MSVGDISFPGIGSGLDVQSIVDRLVEVESGTLRNLEDQRSELEFQRSVLQLVNQRLLDFDRRLGTLRLESTFLSKNVASSNPGLVDATATVDASPGTHLVTVQQIAKPSRAESGLDGSLEANRALLLGNTAGIDTLSVGTDFGSVPVASLDTLLTDTRQAGQGSQAVTAGDTITISGRTKDGTLRTGTFTFNGDGTDTIRRFAEKVREVLQGEVQFRLGPNGELVFYETDPSVAGDVVLDPSIDPATGFTFNDTDFSGSTFSIGVSSTIAGTTNRRQKLVENQVLTVSGAIAAATEQLNNLDQTSSALDDGDIIRITGTDKNGNPVSVDFVYGAANDGTTIQDLVNKISGAYPTSTASFENGKIVLTDDTGGDSQTSMSLTFIDQGTPSAIDLGSFLIAIQGQTNVSQQIYTTPFSLDATGNHELHFTDGIAGAVTGSITLNAQTTLSSLGVTNFTAFTIDVDQPGAGTVQPRPVFGLTPESTVQDLINLINQQVPDVVAQLVDSGGGNLVLQISAARGGQDITLTDVAGGILDRVMLGGGATTASSTDAAAYARAASTATTDFTAVAAFLPDQASGPIYRVSSAAEGSPISDLITGVTINGTGPGHTFTPGNALITTTTSDELNTAPATRSRIFGAARVSQGGTTPGLLTNLPLAQAGFATTPQNASANPLDHTDGFFTINGVRIDVGDVNTTTVDQVIGAVNASGAGVTMSYDPVNDRFVIRANSTGPQTIQLGGGGDTSNFLRIARLTIDQGAEVVTGTDKGSVDPDLPLAQAGFDITPTSGVFTINGVAITVDAGVDSLNDLIQKVNSSGAGVRMSYDASADKIVLEQVLTDDIVASQIQVGSPTDTSNFLVAARLNSSITVPATIGTVRQEAIFTVDGVQYTRKTNQISDITQGVTYTLGGPTSDPVTISITQDEDRAISAIADFIASYNQTMELIDPAPLTPAERELLQPLTQEELDQLSIEELDERLQQRNELRQREFLVGDSVTQLMAQRLRQLITGRVSGVQIGSIFDLGIESAAAGGGAQAAAVTRAKLVADTTDKGEIEQLLRANQTFLDNLRSNPRAVYELFARLGRSEAIIQGSRDLSGGFNASNTVQFTISDGVRVANVQFGAGFHSQVDILNAIVDALADAGFGTDVVAFFDSQSQLKIVQSLTDRIASLQLVDLSVGTDNVTTTLGLTPGLVVGGDPVELTGLALRSRNLIQNETGVGGSLFERIRTGGLIDQRLGFFDQAIQREQERLDQLRERLRLKFLAMDIAVAQLSNISAALERTIQFQLAAQMGRQNRNF